MNLIIDIGNTRAKLALFEGFDLIEKNTILEEEFTLEYITLFFQKNKIENSILSASGVVEKPLLDFLQAKENFILLSHQTPIPIINAYDTPETLGKDRLASAVAAHYFFSKKNCLVIDCGTCTTYNFINEKGEFLGGNITPGLKMRLEAMTTAA